MYLILKRCFDSHFAFPAKQSGEIAESDAVPPQLETVPEDVDIEEDTGDFGELFS